MVGMHINKDKCDVNATYISVSGPSCPHMHDGAAFRLHISFLNGLKIYLLYRNSYYEVDNLRPPLLIFKRTNKNHLRFLISSF